jgi:hypothetical protein
VELLRPLPVIELLRRTAALQGGRGVEAASGREATALGEPFNPFESLQVNSTTHAPQKLTGFISLHTNPVSFLCVPIQTVP